MTDIAEMVCDMPVGFEVDVDQRSSLASNSELIREYCDPCMVTSCPIYKGLTEAMGSCMGYEHSSLVQIRKKNKQSHKQTYCLEFR